MDVVTLAIAAIAGLITSVVFQFLSDAQRQIFSWLGAATQSEEDGVESASYFLMRILVAIVGVLVWLLIVGFVVYVIWPLLQ